MQVLYCILSKPDFSLKYMKAICIALFLVCSTAAGQTVKDLQKASNANSGTNRSSDGKARSSSSSSSGSGSSDWCDPSFCADMLYLFVELAEGLGEAISAFGKEEKRLARRNVEENRLYGLETNLGGGIGFRKFTKLYPQFRLHLGALSFDYKDNILYDETGEFKSREFTTWFNLVNQPNVKWRVGLGALHFPGIQETYLLYGSALEFYPSKTFRVELYGNVTQARSSLLLRPRQETGFRLHYNIWRKGYGNSSVYLGVANQHYYNKLSFPGVDLGVNYFLSFNRFSGQAR